MDLMDLKPREEDVTVTLVHPATKEALKNEDGSEMTINLLSPYSAAYREIMYSRADARLAKARKGQEDELTAKEADMASIETLSKMTTGWNITFGGDQPKYTEAKAVEVYNTLRWIKLQLEEELEQLEVFS